MELTCANGIKRGSMTLFFLIKAKLWPFLNVSILSEAKTKDRQMAAFGFGAGSGGRTRTVSPPRDFESCFVKRSWFALTPVRRTWSS